MPRASSGTISRYVESWQDVKKYVVGLVLFKAEIPKYGRAVGSSGALTLTKYVL